MRRIFSIALVAALVSVLVLPSTALAVRGGVPASENGKGAAASRSNSDADVEAKRKAGRIAEDGDEDRPGARGNGRNVAGANAGGSEEEAPGDGETEQVRERSRSQETSGTVAMKRTGIANALDRLQSNLARMQADLDAGTRSSLPPGLQRAIAKFMSWLGIEGTDEPQTPDDGDGSEETSGTVEPGSGLDDDGEGTDGGEAPPEGDPAPEEI